MWIDLDGLYGFTIYNLIRKAFIMVSGVKRLSFCGPVDLVLVSYFSNDILIVHSNAESKKLKIKYNL